jgi:hypothetical protein
MIDQGHPIHRLCLGLLDNAPELTLEFSRYIHLGYGRTLSRDIFHIKAKHINKDWLADQFFTLGEGQELALHSRVERNGSIFHIPMIDFINTRSAKEVKPLIKPVDEMIQAEVWFYCSGQSLHGYYFQLIEESRWLDYLAKLLLCNRVKRNSKEIIDQRWVAHSLEHRFSALRWSHNTHKYRKLPRIINESEQLAYR